MVISLGQVWVDIMLQVEKIPSAGDYVNTTNTMPTVDGAYRMMLAARRMGAATAHAGIVGTGPWGTMIRNAYQKAGITHIGPSRLDIDSGFRLLLNDDSGKKTFIANRGAETQGDESTFAALDPEPGDIVHLSGNSLMDHTASGIDEFVRRASVDPDSRPYRIVINPTNTLHLVNDRLLEDLVLARPIWSCNRQAAHTLAERLGVEIDEVPTTVGGAFDSSMEVLCRNLGAALRAPLVVRAGARGAWLRMPGNEVMHIDGFPTKAIHTRSAGTCHTGVLCAMLAENMALPNAVRMANAASSLAIEHSVYGVPTPPYRDAVVSLIDGADAAQQQAQQQQ